MKFGRTWADEMADRRSTWADHMTMDSVVTAGASNFINKKCSKIENSANVPAEFCQKF